MFASTLLLLLAGFALSECRMLTETFGMEEKNDQGKIVNGHEVSPHSYPFIVRLRISYSNRKPPGACGGALINSKWVLTAAHCFKEVEGAKVTEVKVYLGAHNFTASEPSMIDVVAENIKTSPEYDGDKVNDVALVRLKKSVKFNRYIKPVCIPRVGKDAVGQTATVAGWGSIGGDKPSSDVLLEVKIPILDDQSCGRKNPEWENQVMMCAGFIDGSKGTCRGDSGGPLFVSGNNNYVTVGIVSFGRQRCNWYGVYTQVEHFTNWIKETASDGGPICVE